MDTILTVNSGSSSLKCGLYTLNEDGGLDCLYHLKLGNLLGDQSRFQVMDEHSHKEEKHTLDLHEIPLDNRHEAALEHMLAWINDHLADVHIIATGHRIVHGGSKFKHPVRIEKPVLDQLKKYIPLAPLHQPYNLRLVEACRKLTSDLPMVGCFDTMFHATQPELERLYAIPQEIIDNRIMKYGFHGLSYDYLQHKLTERGDGDRLTVCCHLGAGSSMCAIRHGESIATSMGFTAVDGIPMGTRCGYIDPGVIFYMVREHNLTIDEVEQILYKKSGWLGISGISSDMIELHQSDSKQAELAIDLYAYRIALEMGRLTAALGGIEQIVFAGGVGENDSDVRRRILERCEWLGVKIDAAANEANADIISSHCSAIKVHVIPTNEEVMIANQVKEVLGL